MKKRIVLIMVTALMAGMAGAAYIENFDTFSLGTLTAQESWEGGTGYDVVASGTGRALKSNTSADKTVRHDATGVDFGLSLDQDGIEYGFDLIEEDAATVNMRMYLRDQRTATYSPSFGLGGGSILLRTNGEGGTNIFGTDFTSVAIYGAGTEVDPGYWLKGESLRFSIILTGEAFDTATVKVYNLDRGGLEIPTGITDVSLGVNPLLHASWTGFNLRGGTTATTIDNVYVTDYVIPDFTNYDEWTHYYNLTGTNALYTANPDGDALNNLYEWGLGGDPTNELNQGIAPTHSIALDDGTYWFVYVYPSNSVAHDLLYILKSDTNLVVAPGWAPADFDVTGVSAPTAGFNYGV